MIQVCYIEMMGKNQQTEKLFMRVLYRFIGIQGLLIFW